VCALSAGSWPGNPSTVEKFNDRKLHGSNIGHKKKWPITLPPVSSESCA
jgi:hypothetical protein